MMNSGDYFNKITKGKFSMRIDSCRNCGSVLKITEFCRDCDQPLHFKCNNCNLFVDDPIHQHGNLSQSYLQHNMVN